MVTSSGNGSCVRITRCSGSYTERRPATSPTAIGCTSPKLSSRAAKPAATSGFKEKLKDCSSTALYEGDQGLYISCDCDGSRPEQVTQGLALSSCAKWIVGLETGLGGPRDASPDGAIRRSCLAAARRS